MAVEEDPPAKMQSSAYELPNKACSPDENELGDNDFCWE